MKWLVQLLQKLPLRTRVVVQTCLYGLGAGVATVGFQLTINQLYNHGLVRLSHESITIFFIGSFVVLVGSSLIVGWLLSSFCPEAAGSGIPQLKLVFWKDFGALPWRVGWVKFIAGALSIGGGSSMGREGPSVQLSAAVASNLAGLTGEPKQNRRASAAAGAAAGLAAAFNTPLAAATFVLEEIVGDLNSRLLGPILLASVLGALTVHGIIGSQPSFAITDAAAPTWIGYVLTPVVAALATLVGVAFQRASLGLRRQSRSVKSVPAWLKPAAGAVITWALGGLVFWKTGHLGVFGLGYGDLSSALAGDIGWQLAALLLVTKFIATFTCYGFGGCGGIFAPTLFFGGFTGVLVAGLIGLQWPIARGDVLALAVVGMSACLGGVVGAPVTGILIVFEMTHEFGLVPALMIGAVVSQALARRVSRMNFYDALLEQDGQRIEEVRPPRDLRSWYDSPIAAIANFQPVILKDLEMKSITDALMHPYERFPVVGENGVSGMLTRKEAEAAVAEKRAPKLEPAVTCLREQTIRELQKLLIASTTQSVVMLDAPGGQVIGIVTLHDLLRAESNRAERAD